MTRISFVPLAAGFAAALAPAAQAAVTDPAGQAIEAFDASLVSAMKSASHASPEARYRGLQPAVARAYDIATMVRFAVGPKWTSFTPAQQQALAAAFERLTIASYVHQITGWSGERIDVDPNVVTRGPDKLVKTQLIVPGQAPVTITYRMREAGGAWKIVDVYYNGAISQLTTRRADFASVVASGGAPALIAHLGQLSEKQMHG